MESKIADIPVSGQRDWTSLKQKLLALPMGKALVIALQDVPRGYPISCAMRMERLGYRVHTRRLPDGVYIWLESLQEIDQKTV